MLQKITKKQASRLGKKYSVDFTTVKFNQWLVGLNTELEHQNVTKGSLDLTAKITLAHLKETPDYYKFIKLFQL